MQQCEDMILMCKWQGHILNTSDCQNMFSLRKTDEGFCCTFNLKDTRELL